ncbi:hypothetical protein E4U35_003800 [Claviceps purpurea]|nr:hypothetical protein E4U35_003800 [Claviceps purpurea]KAG6261794.1 hypothetical protein E4U49_003597 [Claviceps purpurea]
MPRMSTRSSTARSRSEEREAEEASPMGWDPGPVRFYASVLLGRERGRTGR